MKKQIFDTHQENKTRESFVPKKTFEQENLTVEIDEDVDIEPQIGSLSMPFERAMSVKGGWWKKWFIGTSLFFASGVIAQSIQWLIDSWHNQQWIYFSFAIASCSLVILGITAIVNEWRKLVKLKRRMILQEKSQQLFIQSAVDFQQDFSSQDVDNAKQLCEELIKNMAINPQSPEFIKWQDQLNSGHKASEIVYLFSQTVLKPIDIQAQKLISKYAIESAAVVAVSPLAIVDIFFIAWRNIRLINQIAELYHIELGYVSRLRLLRMVLFNMAFAGATEVIHDVGMDWLSQDMSAKLSARIAQGIGVGLLSARLGLKAMAFCRPVAFSREERPRLKHIQREIFSNLKTLILSSKKEKV